MDIQIKSTLVGAGIALAAPLVIEPIKLRFKKRRYLTALKKELVKNRFQAASYVQATASKLGNFDAETGRWLKTEFEAYDGVYADKRIAQQWEKVLNASALEQEEAFNRVNFNNKDLSVEYDPISSPYFDAKYDVLEHMSEQFQQVALELRAKIFSLNQSTAYHREWLMLTITEPTQMKAAKDNERTTLGRIQRTFVAIADLSRRLLEMNEFKPWYKRWFCKIYRCMMNVICPT